jgi:peptidoglycan/xylan/chitin deacetylase (PgdA/CDA1 family)
MNSLRVNAPTFLTKTQVDAMYLNGHEIGGHTLNHANLSALGKIEYFTQFS